MGLLVTMNTTSTDDRINAYLNPRAGLTKENVSSLLNYMEATNGGSFDLTIGTIVVAPSAIATFTFNGQPTAAQTCVINGVTFTAVASGATGNQFNIGGTAAITAQNFVNAVNASTTAGIQNNFTATLAGTVATITSNVPGSAGIYHATNALTNVVLANFALPSAETSRTIF